MTPPLLAEPSLADPFEESTVQRAVSSAADVLFTRDGVTPTTLEAVATRADVPLDVLTDAYPTKQALLVAVLRRWHGGWQGALDRIATEADGPVDEVLAVFSYLEECFADDDWRGCAFINGHAELGRQDPLVAVLVREHFSTIRAHLVAVCARAGIPAHVAGALTLLVEGARVDSAVQRSAEPARTARLGAAMLMSVYTTSDEATTAH